MEKRICQKCKKEKDLNSENFELRIKEKGDRVSRYRKVCRDCHNLTKNPDYASKKEELQKEINTVKDKRLLQIIDKKEKEKIILFQKEKDLIEELNKINAAIKQINKDIRYELHRNNRRLIHLKKEKPIYFIRDIQSDITEKDKEKIKEVVDKLYKPRLLIKREI